MMSGTVIDRAHPGRGDEPLLSPFQPPRIGAKIFPSSKPCGRPRIGVLVRCETVTTSSSNDHAGENPRNNPLRFKGNRCSIGYALIHIRQADGILSPLVGIYRPTARHYAPTGDGNLRSAF